MNDIGGTRLARSGRARRQPLAGPGNAVRARYLAADAVVATGGLARLAGAAQRRARWPIPGRDHPSREPARQRRALVVAVASGGQLCSVSTARPGPGRAARHRRRRTLRLAAGAAAAAVVGDAVGTAGACDGLRRHFVVAGAGRGLCRAAAAGRGVVPRRGSLAAGGHRGGHGRRHLRLLRQSLHHRAGPAVGRPLHRRRGAARSGLPGGDQCQLVVHDRLDPGADAGRRAGDGARGGAASGIRHCRGSPNRRARAPGPSGAGRGG